MVVYKLTKCVSTFIKVGEKALSSVNNISIWRLRCDHYANKPPSKGPWRVLFLGTDEFALQSLQALYHTRQKGIVSRLEIVTAYKGEENAVIKYAKKHNILIHNWPPSISKDEFDIGVVVSFGHLIPSKIIDLFPLGMINVHGSLLPRWRGAAPICHALINGDQETGISIMKIMPKKFDIGSVIVREKVQIHPNETYLELYKKLAILGANLLTETMNQLPDILNTAKPQVETEVTYAPKITPEISFIKWNEMTAEQVYNLQRGLLGIHPLRTYFNNQVIKLLDIKAIPESTKVNCLREKEPGLAIYDKKNKILYVSCQENSWISVGTVIIPGHRPKSATDFGTGFILNRKEKSCIFC
ncbi:methionyl-tRNA formyltransferase, mitochondrial [Nasonia vitripennis]|uniref:Methionyl-tRNA formyltransferase, mitochondrial n=1 Tax=Nasonia vitripennis TaxID=7425 RepID=A0A7M7GF51_NASVI|nr:methionyl-tRNA formyltransferase, mitochondrial [Nasonia vitripennis]